MQSLAEMSRQAFQLRVVLSGIKWNKLPYCGPSNSVSSYQESNGTNFLTMNEYILKSVEMSPGEPVFLFVCLFVLKKDREREEGRIPQLRDWSGSSLALRGGLPGWVGSRLDGSVPPSRCVQEGVSWRGNFWEKDCGLESKCLWLGSGIAGGNENTKRQPRLPLVL